MATVLFSAILITAFTHVSTAFFALDQSGESLLTQSGVFGAALFIGWLLLRRSDNRETVAARMASAELESTRLELARERARGDDLATKLSETLAKSEANAVRIEFLSQRVMELESRQRS